MTRSRLADAAGATASGHWPVGETRTIGRLVITRSPRPFVQDWVDAANEADHDALTRKGLAWVAHPNGHTQLRSIKHLAEHDQRRLSPAAKQQNWLGRSDAA